MSRSKMPTTDVGQFFRLGKTSDDVPLENVLYTTIRTAPDNKSTSQRKVVFKLPKQGFLTSDSGIKLTPVDLAGPGSDEFALVLNPVTGILGSIARCTLDIDGKVVSNLIDPAKYMINDIYSQRRPAALLDYETSMLGLGMLTKVHISDNLETTNVKGLEHMAHGLPVDCKDNNTQFANYNILGSSVATSKAYMVKLNRLVMKMLDLNNLPVYLMKSNDINLTLYFKSDAREWCVGNNNSSLTAGMAEINLDSVELVTSHMLIPADMEAEGIMALRDAPFQFDWVDIYQIPANKSTTTIGTKSSDVYRLNMQGRVLHRITAVIDDNKFSKFFAHQSSLCLGDEEIQLKVNGQNLYDRPLTNPSLIYYQNKLHNDGRDLNVSLYQYMRNTFTEGTTGTEIYASDVRGLLHVLGFDMTNGNYVPGVGGRLQSDPFQGGMPQSTALELTYNVTPVAASQENISADLLFYVHVGKRLVISGNKVEVSF